MERKSLSAVSPTDLERYDAPPISRDDVARSLKMESGAAVSDEEFRAAISRDEAARLLRKESGAAITDEEYAAAAELIMAMPPIPYELPGGQLPIRPPPAGQDFSSWGPGAAGDRRASQRAAQDFAAWDEGAIDRQAAQAGAQEFAAFDPRIADRQAARGAAREFSSWSPSLESRATAPVIRFLEALGAKMQ